MDPAESARVDRFGAVERRSAGELTEPGFSAAQILARDGIPAANAPPSTEVVLELPSFSIAAEMAGSSRVMGGYHIQADNVEGLALGRKVAEYSWPLYRTYFDGSAAVAAAHGAGG